MSGYVKAKLVEADENEKVINIPDDIDFNYSQECVDWLKQYTLTPADMIKHKVYWSNKRNQLIYLYTDMYSGKLACIQARNFGSGPKYYNQGNSMQVLPIYKQFTNHPSATLVIVEDTISAIKVSTVVDAMPLLGSYMPLPKITRIKKLGYNRVVVWLDHDKYKEAMTLADKFRYLVMDTEVVTTDLDPKLYTHEFITTKVF